MPKVSATKAHMERESMDKNIPLERLPFNDKLRRIRTALGITQQQVAKALNVDRSTYTYYETGKTSPDIKTIMKLVRIFNVTYDDLLGISPSVNRTHYVSDHKASPFSHINELTKQEKLVLLSYRLLNKEDRKKYLTSMLEKVREDTTDEF